MNLTRQQAFDKMWSGLKSQSWIKSVHSAGYCAYRGMDNARCAFGWLIPDEKYRPEWDGDTVDSCPEGISAIMPVLGMDEKDLDFYKAAQVAHDKASDPRDMEKRFRLLAEFFSLNVY